MKKLVALMVIVGGLTACSSAPQGESQPADNSDKIVRDRGDAAVTAGDQANAKSDLTVTQAIRAAVGADRALYVNADDVKIISANGVVTLRGSVGSAYQKASIGLTAQRVAGVSCVNNELDIEVSQVPWAGTSN